jgi:hypothetical protein
VRLWRNVADWALPRRAAGQRIAIKRLARFAPPPTRLISPIMQAARALYTRITSEASVRDREVKNGLIQLTALSLTKSADGLIDPKLVLAWLLGALGAPAALIGALVPIREAGALLPQLALARPVENTRHRARAWALGSVLQGIAAAGIAIAALTLSGTAAGVAIVACLVVFSLARALCSISHKDTLARSIPKTRRGTVTGLAGSIAAATVLAYGAALSTGLLPLSVLTISLGILTAATFWTLAALIFLRLDETSDGTEAEDTDETDLAALARPLFTDAQLRRLIEVRALLTATALAPPFLVLMSSANTAGGLGQLGPLVLASSGAAIASSWVWGRLSDHSSRLTLAASGALAALVLGTAAVIGALTGGLGGVPGAVLAIFAAQIAYEGVRAGRKLHLTDMTTDDTRARYTALSNTLIGGVLVLGGGLGVIADLFGPAAALAGLALLCAVAAPLALTLDEVQDTPAQ